MEVQTHMLNHRRALLHSRKRGLLIDCMIKKVTNSVVTMVTMSVRGNY